MTRTRHAGPVPRFASRLLVATSLVALIVGPACRSSPPTDAMRVFPASGALLGAWPSSRAGPTPDREARMRAFQALVGHPLWVERTYHDWFDPFPDVYDEEAKAAGRLLIMSWSAKDGTGAVPWAQIAGGRYDAMIRTRAAALARFGAPLVFVFQHEPNGAYRAGTPARFVAAYRHVHELIHAAGATNVIFGFVMFDSAFRSGAAQAYYPGDVDVDVVGVDVYNWFGCPGRTDPWLSFAQKAGPFHDFLVTHHKLGVIAELGSNEDPARPGRKAEWILDAFRTVTRWADVKAVAWFDGRVGPTCDWRIDTSPSSLAAFRAVAGERSFEARPGP